MGDDQRLVRRRSRAQRLQLCCLLGVVCIVGGDRLANAQEPSAPQTIAEPMLQAAIDNLGKLDDATRTAASQTIRRTPASQAVPALLRAIATHQDGYVRYRALVLLTGFNDSRTESVMRGSLASANDRLRSV